MTVSETEPDITPAYTHDDLFQAGLRGRWWRIDGEWWIRYIGDVDDCIPVYSSRRRETRMYTIRYPHPRVPHLYSGRATGQPISSPSQHRAARDAATAVVDDISNL